MNDNYENSPFFIYASTILLDNKSEFLTYGVDPMWKIRIEKAAIATHDAVMCTKHYHIPKVSFNAYRDMFNLDFLLFIARNKNIKYEHKENILNYVLALPGVYLDNPHNQETNSMAIDQHAYATMIIFKNTGCKWDIIVAETERKKLSQISEKNILAKKKNIERI